MSLNTVIGGSASDSYCTVEEADAYLVTTGYTMDKWGNLSVPAKERLLKLGCLILDSFPYVGSSADEANSDNWDVGHVPQKRKFPRDEDTQPVCGSAAIPVVAKEAQIEITYLYCMADFGKSDPKEAGISKLSVKGDFTAEYVQGAGNMLSSAGVSSRTVVLFLLRDYVQRGVLI